MATADEVIVAFEARIGKYERDLRRAAQQFERSTKGQRDDMRRLERQVERSSGAIGSQVRGLAATFAAAFSARQIQQFADSYTRFTNRLKVAGAEGANLAQVQNQLFQTAQRYGVELESLGTLYARASQSAGELGVSQEELLRFTEGVSSALKIQGTSAQESSGALLQLSQALASGIVRAEEYNSINEGALPILQAVANNLDEAGGSVGRLRQLVVDGKVTSEAFFKAFLKGSDDLEKQAESATLTIENSFTVLSNALSKYIGESDASLGATQRISAAIIALSENLDDLVTVVTVLSAVLLGRFVAGAVAGGTALRTVSAYASIATTSLAGTALAARGAGAALLSAFGGPVGLAITALTLGIGYLATETAKTRMETERLRAAADRNYQTYIQLADAADSAASETKDLADEQLVAQARAAGLTIDTDNLADAHYRAAVAARAQRIEEQKLAAAQSAKDYLKVFNEELLQARQPGTAVSRGQAGMAGVLTGQLMQGSDAARQREREAYLRIVQSPEYKRFRRDQDVLEAMQDAPIEPDTPVNRPGTSDSSGSSSDEAEKARKERERLEKERLRRDRMAADAEDQAQIEQLEAERRITNDIYKRADLERQILDREYDIRRRRVLANEDFSDKERAAQLAYLDNLYGVPTAQGGDPNRIDVTPRGGLYDDQIDKDIAEEERRMALDMLDRRRAALSAEARAAETRQEQFEAERRILKLDQEIERRTLEQAIANGEIADAATARALLARQQRAERSDLERSQQGPLGQYGERARDDEYRIQEAAARKIQDLNKTLTDAITENLGVDDPFIKDLFSIFLDKAIFGPLAEALDEASSGSGGLFGGLLGGVGDVLGGLFGGGKAIGGNVQPGKAYMVGENGPEPFVPQQAGVIIPNHRLQGGQSGGGGGPPQIYVDARGAVMNDQFARDILGKAKMYAADAGKKSYEQSMKDAPAAVAGRRRYGTS